MKKSPPVIYPALGSLIDFGYFRVSGVGLGNALFCYFNSFVLAKKTGGKLITPAWRSVKIGHILRGERANRIYNLSAQPDEVTGIKKILYLLSILVRGTKIDISLPNENMKIENKPYICYVSKFSFMELKKYKDDIRERILALAFSRNDSKWPWGAGGFAAVHVRLGDFALPNSANSNVGAVNTRIPMSWYINTIKDESIRNPDLKFIVFSDGHPEELKPILELGCRFHVGDSDLEDLLKLATANVLIGSNSTYSHWAAFLGNGRTVWLDTTRNRYNLHEITDDVVFVPPVRS